MRAFWNSGRSKSRGHMTSNEPCSSSFFTLLPFLNFNLSLNLFGVVASGAEAFLTHV